MATGPIKAKSKNVNMVVDVVKSGYASAKREVDAMTQFKGGAGGSNWTALGVALGEFMPDGTTGNATAAQTIYDNMNAILGYMTNANDAASPMDSNGL